MAFQSTIRQKMTSGFVGDVTHSGPIRAQTGKLYNSDAALNVVGRALVHTSGSDGVFQTGGSGRFAGILSGSKQYATSGTSAGALTPTLVLANNTEVEAIYFATGLLVELSTSANIGDGVAYATATGILAAAPAGVAPANHTLIPNAKVIRNNLTAAGYAYIELTE